MTGLISYSRYLGYIRPQLLQPTSGAAEAFSALPNREYCELVNELYDANGELRHATPPLPNLASSDALKAVK
jgi:hypothetical protein